MGDSEGAEEDSEDSEEASTSLLLLVFTLDAALVPSGWEGLAGAERPCQPVFALLASLAADLWCLAYSMEHGAS